MTKGGVFLDTSFVVAIINSEDTLHLAALELEQDLKQYSNILITEAILFEIGNSFPKTN